MITKAMNDPVMIFLLSPGELRAEAARARHSASVLERRLNALDREPLDTPEIQAARAAIFTKLAATRRFYGQKQREAEQREAEVTALIEALSNADSRLILRLRYCDGLHWSSGKAGHPSVLGGMAEAGLYYSERQMYRMHLHALAEARRLYEAGQGALCSSA